VNKEFFSRFGEMKKATLWRGFFFFIKQCSDRRVSLSL
jgi:hypothetical protein